MGKQTVDMVVVHALIDEATLRRTLLQIERLRKTAGLGLRYGAVVSLEVPPDGNCASIQTCRVRAGGWTDELPPSTRLPGGGLPA